MVSLEEKNDEDINLRLLVFQKEILICGFFSEKQTNLK